MVKYSEKEIIKTIKEKNTTIFTKLPLEEIRKCLDDIRKYVSDWEQIYSRYDQVAVLKDYYRKLERKARFDGFWKDNKGIKQPKNTNYQTIKFE